MRCKGPDNYVRNVAWKWIKNAWLPAVTVCAQQLYAYQQITAVPVVRINSINTNGLTGQVNGTIISQGSSPITSYGIVWSTTNPPTIEDSITETGTTAETGAFTESTNGFDLDNGVEYFFRVYATNAIGTAYSEVLSETASICLIQGTQITLANGTRKAIEDITYNDELLVWNFDESEFDTAKPIWIATPFELPKYSIVKFNDGSELGTIAGEGHSIFDVTLGQFNHLNSNDTPIHTRTINEEQTSIFLTGSKVHHEKMKFYNIITNKHFNMYANGILTSTKLNNIYPIHEMKFIKDDRELNSNVFEVSNELFEGLRLAEQPLTPQLLKKIEMLKKEQYAV